MEPAVGDVVKVVHDVVAIERGVWWRVFGLYESKTMGPCVELMRVEHFPSPDWPKGQCYFHRTIPVGWVEVSAKKTAMWKEYA